MNFRVVALRLILSSLLSDADFFSFTLSGAVDSPDSAAALISALTDVAAVFAISAWDGRTSPVCPQARSAVQQMLLHVLDQEAT
jgi:hypothetical protein